MHLSISIKQSLFLVSLFASSATWAFYPFITDDTGTQGKGGNRLELAYDFVKNHNDILDEGGLKIGRGTDTANIFAMTYTRGITDKVDVFIGGARQINPVNGWLNTEIGLKWSFAGDQEKGWSAAIKPSVILPVSKSMQNNGLGNAETNVSISLIGSYLSDDYEVHLNTGYTSNNMAKTPSADPQRRDLWSVSVSPVFILNDQWKLGVDLGLQTSPGYNSKYQAFGGVGVSYAPVKNLQIGMGLFGAPAIQSNDNAWAYTFTTGNTYQF